MFAKNVFCVFACTLVVNWANGAIFDAACDADAIDRFNNVKVFPRVQSILQRPYFRFHRTNLRRPCPFWEGDEGRCAMRFCHVQPCTEQEVPAALYKNEQQEEEEAIATQKQQQSGIDRVNQDEDCNDSLSYLNTTLSAKTRNEIERWKAHDDQNDDFCVVQEEGEREYVDLLLNPERYTGYKGQSAHRIWKSIYTENCFRPKSSKNLYIRDSTLHDMCLEERVYYRAISGLHTSINIHLCANYLHDANTLANPAGVWGPNLAEFRRRFSPETTNGEGPNWINNLYFLYLLELRAIAKIGENLEKERFYTGDDSEDWDTRQAIKDLVRVISAFPYHFDESAMFASSSGRLKYEFREHFRNVTRIMDCVGCDKCRLWGKLQTQGLGTALKILFSDRYHHHHHQQYTEEDDENGLGGTRPLSRQKAKQHTTRNHRLQRDEIVSLFNAFGRLATSIYKLDDFREMMLKDSVSGGGGEGKSSSYCFGKHDEL